MQWISTILGGAVQEILADLLLATLSLAAGYAVYYIHQARRTLQAKSESEAVDRIIARAAAITEATVLSLEGTVAKGIRQAIADGRATREELVALKDRAIDDVMGHLGAAGVELLRQAVGNVRDWIGDLVEAQLETIKRAPAGSVAARVEEFAAPKSQSPSSSGEGSASA